MKWNEGNSLVQLLSIIEKELASLLIQQILNKRKIYLLCYLMMIFNAVLPVWILMIPNFELIK